MGNYYVKLTYRKWNKRCTVARIEVIKVMPWYRPDKLVQVCLTEDEAHKLTRNLTLIYGRDVYAS